MTIDKEMVRSTVEELVRQPVRNDQPLVTGGLIDSLRVLHLIMALEKKLEIRIPTDEIQPEDFDSIDGIMETLGRVVRR